MTARIGGEMKKKYNPSLWYRERDAEWARMKRSGMTTQQIAERYHYSMNGVQERIRLYEATYGVDL